MTTAIGGRLAAALWFLFGALFWAGCTIGVLAQLIRELSGELSRAAPPTSTHLGDGALTERIRRATTPRMAALPAHVGTDDLQTVRPGWEDEGGDEEALELATREDVRCADRICWNGVWLTLHQPTPMNGAWN